jgi:hypothetical protein
MTLHVDDAIILAGAIFALVFVFLCICVVCDQHLVPAVETIIEEFDVPEEIAAVTLIAFGSSSPEILLNTVRYVGIYIYIYCDVNHIPRDWGDVYIYIHCIYLFAGVKEHNI